MNKSEPIVPESEREAIFGRKASNNPVKPVPVEVADLPLGTIWIPQKISIPGGPGMSDRYSGRVVLDKQGIPLGLWYYPNNQAQHPNVSRYWLAAASGIVQLKKTAEQK